MHIFSRFIDFRNRDKALFVLIVLAAVIVRVVLFGAHPAGLNQDEASVGYDAWALMNYGVDRNRIYASRASDGMGQRTKCFVRLFINAVYCAVRIECFLGSRGQSDFFAADGYRCIFNAETGCK